MLYRIEQGSVSLGGEIILDHIDFHIKGKEKIALVGRNGSGKTTLLRLIAGELTLDRDDKRQTPGIWTARDTSMGMLSQNIFSHSDMEKTVEDLIMDLCPQKDPYSREYYDYSLEYHKIFTGLGFGKEDHNRVLKSFSGGEQTRIALIGLLLMEPDILLLDEPTNHLDLSAVFWLEEHLKGYPGAVVIVSHDRYFLDQTVEAVWELSAGKVKRYAGNYTGYRRIRQKEREIQLKKYEAFMQESARLTALIERYKHKPSKASMARSKRKVLERMEKVEKPAPEQVHLFTDDICPREVGSKRVLEADKLKIGYTFPIKEISLTVKRGQKIGIIGANGTGKTTFLKTIAGVIPAISGKILMGRGIHAGYYDQHTARKLSDKRVFEHFSACFPQMNRQDAKKILGHYLFRGDETGKRLDDLSGGERSRLYLAEMLTEGLNLLLLDEPTNHMDIPARETLESAFQAYKGTILFISHDRYFIKELAGSLLIFEEDKVMYYPFGYEHYQEHLKKEQERKDGVTAAIEAENTRIVSELHAVPERKRIQSARLNTDQSFTDWQLGLAAEGLMQCREALCRLEERKEMLLQGKDMMEEEKDAEAISIDIRDYLQQLAGWQEEYERAMTRYQQACLLWYEKYMDYEEAFASYRE